MCYPRVYPLWQPPKHRWTTKKTANTPASALVRVDVVVGEVPRSLALFIPLLEPSGRTRRKQLRPRVCSSPAGSLRVGLPVRHLARNLP
jgi:hypothetical protein